MIQRRVFHSQWIGKVYRWNFSRYRKNIWDCWKVVMTGILGTVLEENERWVDRDLITFFRWHDRDMLTHHENKLNKVLRGRGWTLFGKLENGEIGFSTRFDVSPHLSTIRLSLHLPACSFASHQSLPLLHNCYTLKGWERTLTFWASCRVLKLKTSTQQTAQEGEFNYQFDSWFTSEPPSLLCVCSTIIEPIVSIICEHWTERKRVRKIERKTFITTPENPHKSLMQTLKRSKPNNFRNFLLYLRWLIDTFI